MVLDVVAVRRMGCSSRQIRRCRENMLSSTPQSFSMSVSSIENDDDILFAGVHIKLGTRWFNWSPARNLEAFHPDKRGCRNEKTPPSWIWPILACMKGWNHLRVSVPSPHFGPAGMISSWPARQSHLKAFSESSVDRIDEDQLPAVSTETHSFVLLSPPEIPFATVLDVLALGCSEFPPVPLLMF